jgi:hypothetical protein
MAERSGVSIPVVTVVLGGLVSLGVSLLVGVNSAALERNADAATERRHAYVDFAGAAAACADLTVSDAITEDERWSKLVEAFKASLDQVEKNPSTASLADFPMLTAAAGPDCESDLQRAAAGLYVIAPLNVWASALDLDTAAVNLRIRTVLQRHSTPTDDDHPDVWRDAYHAYYVALETFQEDARTDVLSSAGHGILAPDTVRSLALGLLAVGVAASVVVLVLTVRLRRRLTRLIAESQQTETATLHDVTIDY